jgi:hypothetical protein
MLMKNPKSVQIYIDALKKQEFSEIIPGTLVKDMNTLLEIMETTNLKLTPSKTSISLNLLPALNEKLAVPFQVSLPPKYTSGHFPNLKALFLLLRASMLTQLLPGKEPYITIHEDHYGQWKKLNPTEQFVWLWESLVLRAHPEIIGEDGDISRRLSDIMDFGMACLKHDWVNNDGKKYARYSPGYSNMALMQLFGFIDVLENKTENKERDIRKISLTSFGRSFFGVFTEIFDDIDWLFEPEIIISSIKDNLIDAKKTIEPQKQAPQKGSFVFDVSLGQCKMKIELPVNDSLDSLFHEIIDSIDFDYDHLYEFRIKNTTGITKEYGHPYLDSCDEYADKVELSALELNTGQEFTLIYDFGDNWQFKIKLTEAHPDSKIKKAKLLEKKGEAPKQYRSWDE